MLYQRFRINSEAHFRHTEGRKWEQVQFSEAQQRTFEKLRNILASEYVILRYPDYKKAFDLTTDASAYGIGAVLSQEGRPITMISRTLSDREVNYATGQITPLPICG